MKQQAEVPVEYPVEFNQTFERVETIIIPKKNREIGVLAFSYKNEDGSRIVVVYRLQLDEQTNTYSIAPEIEEFEFKNKQIMNEFLERLTEYAFLRASYEVGRDAGRSEPLKQTFV